MGTQQQIRSIEELIRFVDGGNKVTYLFFWGHQPETHGMVSKSCLSNWYPAVFTLNGITYATTEHYMMAHKATLFGDTQSYQAILNAKTPKEAKALGREVTGFREELWNAHRIDIMVTGNEAKFSQHHDMKEFLLSTHEAILVEASPYDRIWGIGMSVDHPKIEDPKAWKGLNLLGFALMEVRRRLQPTPMDSV
ncbi:MAG: NADAR family protein [Oscillochloridaceae bacterium umkhey_bin13]